MPTKTLTEAQGSTCFWINEGPIVKNLSELKEALKEMSSEKFDYHTKRDGNNFAVWIDEVLGEKELAKKIFRLKTKKGYISAINKFIK